MPLVSPATLELPSPDAGDAADSARLVEIIRDACAEAGGSISFDAFMELALYSPGLGYYSAPRNRFGERGDFVTAPEISPRFGACVARQAAQVLDHIGGGSILEAGAGSGALAVSVLETLEGTDHGHVAYQILERSASARAFQRERLGRLADRVQWLDDFPVAGFRGVMLANELLDAIPAARFQVVDGVPVDLEVSAQAEGFDWCAVERPGTLSEDVKRVLTGTAEGYRGEFGPARGAWVAEAGARLAAGALLLLDYGYPRTELYHPQRVDGTVACHYRHRVHADPFVWPGLQDISVHVDFTAIAEAGTAAGLDLAGYSTQAHFLLDTGLVDGLDDPLMDSVTRMSLAAQIQRLTLPAEMGEAIKVMALTRNVTTPLIGFTTRNQTHRL